MPQTSNDQLLSHFMQTFYGYGNYQGDYWFIGMEEGGGDTWAEVQKRLTTWQARGAQPLEDLVDYHLAVGITHPFTDHPKIQPTWGKLIRLLLSLTGATPTRETIRQLQRTQWARHDGNVCLLELLPLPSPSTQHWLYAEHSALPALATREHYRTVWSAQRITGLQAQLARYHPKVVIFYSFGYLAYWRAIVGGEFQAEAGGAFYQTRVGETHFVVIKHPAATGVTSAYFEEVGRFIRERQFQLHQLAHQR